MFHQLSLLSNLTTYDIKADSRVNRCSFRYSKQLFVWRSEKFRNFQENIRSGLLIDSCIPIFSVLNFGKFSRTSIIPLPEEVLFTEHLVVGSGTYSRPCQLMMELFYEK